MMDQAREALGAPLRDGYGRFTAKPPQFYDEVADLRSFSRMTTAGRQAVLRGEREFSVLGFDIEATHLKPNVGRIICCSFKPLGGEVYTYHAHERRFKEKNVYDDSKLAVAIRNELERYDILVGWNSRIFDTRFINARTARVGARTKEAQWHVDGLHAWRSKTAAWGKLAAVQQYLDVPTHKTEIDWAAWMQALGWDRELARNAMAEIIEHCEKDVTVLEEVYLKLVDANMIRALRRDGGIA